ncbi:MAG: hypothetical protein ACAI43_10075 [Phycisphaerae bacterium]|nr:hypothetical protein [Tepidisphaeraceae bacterium]
MGEAATVNFEDAIRRRPFVPFAIVLEGGGRHEVTDPLRVATGGNTVVVVAATGVESFRKSEIAAIEVHENGARPDEAAADLGEVLMQRRRARPFRPYVIVTTDGRRYPVREPLRAGYNGRYVLVLPDYEASVRIERDELAAIESE